MPEVILPKTSPEVAKNTIKEYANDPAQFLRSVATSLQNENDLFLDRSLQGAASIFVSGHSDDALQLLTGAFFRYECTARELKKTGKSIPFIGPNTFTRSSLEIARLTQGLILAGGDTKAAIRQRVMRIERDDPEIGDIVKQFLSNDQDAFIEGVHSTHLELAFLDQSESELGYTLPEPTLPSVLPVARRSIVRSALLETILGQDSFIQQVLHSAEGKIPNIISRVIHTGVNAEEYAHIYLLFASLVINGIMQEFFQRGNESPEIKEGDPHLHPDPLINKAIRENSPEAGRLIREYNVSILKEIEDVNPHLYWCIYTLLAPLSSYSGTEIALSTAINGVVNPYSSLKAGLSK